VQYGRTVDSHGILIRIAFAVLGGGRFGELGFWTFAVRDGGGFCWRFFALSGVLGMGLSLFLVFVVVFGVTLLL
jgi:hypothetical protein